MKELRNKNEYDVSDNELDKREIEHEKGLGYGSEFTELNKDILYDDNEKERSFQDDSLLKQTNNLLA